MDSRGYDGGGQYNLGSMSAMSYADGATQGDLVADSLGRYLPEVLLSMLFVGPVVRRLSKDVLLVAARPA